MKRTGRKHANRALFSGCPRCGSALGRKSGFVACLNARCGWVGNSGAQVYSDPYLSIYGRRSPVDVDTRYFKRETVDRHPRGNRRQPLKGDEPL